MIGYARMMLHRLSNTGCHARMREHLALERLPHDELRHRQFWLAATLLQHAYATVPHYAAAMNGLGMRPELVRSFGDYARLPVLTRDVIRQHASTLVSSALPRKAVAALGAMTEACPPAQVPRDKAARDETQANWLLCLTFAGWTQADMVVRLYASSGGEAGDLLRPGVREWLAGTLSVDACAHTPEDVPKWVRAIRRCGRAYLLGSAHVMSEMASYIEKSGIRPANVRGAVASCGGANPEQRQRIGASFGCAVHALYGCAEVPCIAMECAQGNLHMLTHSAYVEFAPDAECGPPHVLVTDINNRAMPMIRFATGDRAVPLAGECACGRGFPLMRMAASAETWFQAADGSFLPGGELSRQVAELCGGTDVRLRQDCAGHVRVVVAADDSAMAERVEALCRSAVRDGADGLSLVVEPGGRDADAGGRGAPQPANGVGRGRGPDGRA